MPPFTSRRRKLRGHFRGVQFLPDNRPEYTDNSPNPCRHAIVRPRLRLASLNRNSPTRAKPAPRRKFPMPNPPAIYNVPAKLAYQGRPSSATLRNSRIRFRYWYDNIIDWMLVNPGKPMGDCAKAVGRSVSTIYIVTASDVFKARLADRRSDYNARLSSDIAAASSNVALLALGELQSRLSDNPAKIPIGMIADITDKALNRLGYGVAPVVQGPTVHVTTQVLVSPGALREAQEKMRTVQELNSRDIVERSTLVKHSRKDNSDYADLDLDATAVDVSSTTISSN